MTRSGALLDVSGATGLGLVLGLLGLIVLWRRREHAMSVWLAVWAFSPFPVLLLASLKQPIFVDRYLLVAAPAFALLGGVAVMGVRRRMRTGLVALVVLFTSVGLAEWYAIGENGNWRSEDWRSAVAYVRGHTDGDVVVLPWWANPAAKYYGAHVVDTSTADSVWVLSWSEDGHDLSVSERAQLGFGRHRLVESREFGWRVTAQLWRRSSAP